MSILGLVLSLFGVGGAVAKSEYDARQKMNSQYVKEIDEERRWLKQQQHPPGMWRQCYNRVLEFDVAHAEVRRILSEIDPERLRKWEELGVAISRYGIHGFLRQCCERPNYNMYEYRWHIDIAETKGIFDELKQMGFDMDDPKIDPKTRESGIREGHRKAMGEWFEANHPAYVAMKQPSWYNVYNYIYEVARKTAYDNGYYPSSYNPNRSLPTGYPTIYDGRFLGGLRSDIDFMYGIPDQEERARLAQKDIDYPR